MARNNASTNRLITGITPPRTACAAGLLLEFGQQALDVDVSPDRNRAYCQDPLQGLIEQATRVLSEKIAILPQLIDYVESAVIIADERITFRQRRSRIAIRHTIRLRLGEGDEAAGKGAYSVFVITGRHDVPAGIGAQGQLMQHRGNACDFVAVRVDLDNVRWNHLLDRWRLLGNDARHVVVEERWPEILVDYRVDESVDGRHAGEGREPGGSFGRGYEHAIGKTRIDARRWIDSLRDPIAQGDEERALRFGLRVGIVLQQTRAAGAAGATCTQT